MKLNYFLKLSALILFLSFNFTSFAQWTQVGDELLGEAVEDRFGSSVSLSADGSIMAVGSESSDNTGYYAGLVKVYQNISGDWIQLGQTLEGQGYYATFGFSIDINADGTILAVGAPGINSGHVRVYRYIDNLWEQIGEKIEGESVFDASGSSVCISADGNTVAIGAPQNEASGDAAGHVRIYENNSDNWEQVGNDIDAEASGDHLGASINMSADGNIIAIGASFNDGNGTTSGQARVFQNIENNWQQIGDDIDGEFPGDHAGFSVSLSLDGAIIAVGSRGNDENGNSAGQVRVFENNANNWEQIGNSIYGIEAEDYFGSYVSLSADGTVVAIGSDYPYGIVADSIGYIGVFHNISGTWTQIGDYIEETGVGDWSVQSLSINNDGHTLAIGGYPRTDSLGNNGTITSTGHVRVYNFPVESNIYLFENTNPNDEIDASTTLNIENCDLDFEQVDSAFVFSIAYINDTLTEVTIHVYTGTEFVELVGVVSTPITGIYELEIFISCPTRNFNNYQIKIVDYIDTGVFTNIADIDNSIIRIYPNPAVSVFTIQNGNFNGQPYTINCYSSIGVLLYSKNIESEKSTIEISQWAEGVYIIEVDSEKFKFIKK